jgi:hypothetical protein
LGENAALKAAVADFTKSLQELGFLDLMGVSMRECPKINFDTSYGRRHDIMMHFVEMMSKGLIECTEKRLTEFLSETTNLGSVEAIRSLYYRCQSEYAKVAL